MNRAYSLLNIKAVDAPSRRFAGIASTPSTDRMGDIVESQGARFRLPLPLLWQHDAKDPIGWVQAARVTDQGIEIEGEIADVPDAGPLRERLTHAWQMLRAGLVRGLSIGFAPIETKPLKGSYGLHFKVWDWLELSAVTIPANQEATITAIKAASGHSPRPGASGPTRTTTAMKSLQEELLDLRAARAERAARMEELVNLRTAEGRQSTTEEAGEFDALAAEVERLSDDIRAKTVEAMHAASAQPVSADPSVHAASRSRGGPAIHLKGQDQDDAFQGQSFTRMVIARAIARLDDVPPSAVAQARWGKSNPTLVRLIKANEVAGGGTGTGEWGAELVQADGRYTGDFIEYLTSRTVYDRLPLRTVPAHVTIKGQDGAATGYWVGESKAIPVTKADFSAVTLTPLKVAALAVVSNELLRYSSPSAEMLVRDALADASSQRVDTTFLSADAAVAGVSPAGLLNGVAATASSGVDAADVRTDIKALYSGFITAKNATGLWWVMSPTLAKSLQLMRSSLDTREFDGLNQAGGTFEGDPVATGDNVNAAHLILLRPSDIYRIGDSGVQVAISREAAIEQNSSPTGATDTPVGASTAWTSMFQEDSTAIRVIRSINFAKRRANAVAYVSDADYGAAASA